MHGNNQQLNLYTAGDRYGMNTILLNVRLARYKYLLGGVGVALGLYLTRDKFE